MKNKALGVDFQRDRKFGPYRGLFYCSKLKLAIDVWDEEENEKNIDLYKYESIQTSLSRLDPAHRLMAVSVGEILANVDEVLLRVIDKFEKSSS